MWGYVQIWPDWPNPRKSTGCPIQRPSGASPRWLSSGGGISPFTFAKWPVSPAPRLYAPSSHSLWLIKLRAITHISSNFRQVRSRLWSLHYPSKYSVQLDWARANSCHPRWISQSTNACHSDFWQLHSQYHQRCVCRCSSRWIYRPSPRLWVTASMVHLAPRVCTPAP